MEDDKEHSKRVSPDGSVEYGPAYVPVARSLGQRAKTWVLRAVIRPIRSLL